MNTKNIIIALSSMLAAGNAFGQAGQFAKLGPSIAYAELSRMLSDAKSGLRLIDVRTAEEYAGGHIPGAELLPYDEIEAKFSEPNKERPIVVYCRSGRRSAIAAAELRSMGYKNVSDFGAVSDWKGKLTKGPKP